MVDFAFRYYVARYKVEAICQKKKRKEKKIIWFSLSLAIRNSCSFWLAYLTICFAVIGWKYFGFGWRYSCLYVDDLKSDQLYY